MSVAHPATSCVLNKKTPSKEGVGKLPLTGEEENPEESQGETKAWPARGRDLLRVGFL